MTTKAAMLVSRTKMPSSEFSLHFFFFIFCSTEDASHSENIPIQHRRKPEILFPPPNQSVPSAAVEPNLGSKNIRRTLLVGRLQLRLKKRKD
jgi:hypothetical protein